MKAHEVVDLLTALKTLDPRGFVTVDNTTITVWHTVLNRDPEIAARDAMQTAYELVAKPGAAFPAPGDFRALVSRNRRVVRIDLGDDVLGSLNRLHEVILNALK